ncbi:hypothetical protein Tco_0664462 [Tanacetum coccineum]
MKQYSEITPEDIELILWGDLKIMMESSTEENDQGDFWNNQQEWEIVRWRLYEACGVCILELKDGTVIYMLVERKYPLSKELLQQMLDLGLEVEEESTAALQLGSQFTLLHSKELASPKANDFCSHKTHLERHEEQIETILNHLDELRLERIEHMKDKIEGLEQIRHDDEIVLARVRISTLEIIIEDIQVRHRSDMKSLLDTIHELKNHKGGPPDY